MTCLPFTEMFQIMQFWLSVIHWSLLLQLTFIAYSLCISHHGYCFTETISFNFENNPSQYMPVLPSHLWMNKLSLHEVLEDIQSHTPTETYKRVSNHRWSDSKALALNHYNALPHTCSCVYRCKEKNCTKREREGWVLTVIKAVYVYKST